MGKTKFILTEEDKKAIVKLAEAGYTDKEIANRLGKVGSGTVFYWRKQLKVPSKFTYDKNCKIKDEELLSLFNSGLSDYKIADILRVSPDGVYHHRISRGYLRSNDLRINKGTPLSDFQKAVLVGTLLGDSTLRLAHGTINPKLSCMHGIKQKEYCEYKTEIFATIGAKCTYHKRNTVDKRTGIFYEDATLNAPANPQLLEFYHTFYKNDKKRIPISIIQKYFTEASLAFLFMDDGYKTKFGYSIATNCFKKSDIERFRKFLKSKYGLDCSFQPSNNLLYIKAKSKERFKTLVSPYMCKCVEYKL